METKQITPEMREQLRKPLPPEAISTHPTKTFLSAIKAIYVEERLNDVFGIGEWRTKAEFIESAYTKPDKNGFVAKMVVVKLTFEVPTYSIYHECYGGNDNADLGDAYKGATTDAITKVGSYLEIGIDVFKGKAQSAPAQTNTKPAEPSYTPNQTYKKTPEQEQEDDNKPWITDEIFQQAIYKLLEAGTITKETPEGEVLKVLRTKYKVAKKYGDLVLLALK